MNSSSKIDIDEEGSTEKMSSSIKDTIHIRGGPAFVHAIPNFMDCASINTGSLDVYCRWDAREIIENAWGPSYYIYELTA